MGLGNRPPGSLQQSHEIAQPSTYLGTGIGIIITLIKKQMATDHVRNGEFGWKEITPLLLNELDPNQLPSFPFIFHFSFLFYRSIIYSNRQDVSEKAKSLT